MSELLFGVIVLSVCVFLWWLGFIATKRMRLGKNKEREEIARRNLERHAREQAEVAERAGTEMGSERTGAGE